MRKNRITFWLLYIALLSPSWTMDIEPIPEQVLHREKAMEELAWAASKNYYNGHPHEDWLFHH